MMSVNEIFFGSTFYQHGIGHYYLTPRQYEQLKWREDLNKRRRTADHEYFYKCERLNDCSVEGWLHENNTKHSMGANKNLLKNWREEKKRRIQEEEAEQTFHRNAYPSYYQILHGKDGRQKRFPVTAMTRHCKAHKVNSKRLAPLEEIVSHLREESRDDNSCR
jgi:hypothetical protein